jgi:hypothetical protein
VENIFGEKISATMSINLKGCPAGEFRRAQEQGQGRTRTEPAATSGFSLSDQK